MACLRERALASIAVASVAAVSLAAPGSGATRPRGAVENCSSISGFGASLRDFDRQENLVVGPTAVLRAGRTLAYAPSVGGDKLFVAVRGGHRVTAELSRRTHRNVGLVFGRFPDGDVRLRDTRRIVTFVACQRGESADRDLDSRPVSGWVGGLLATSPRCVPLRVWVDDEPRPRRAVIRFGVHSCG